MVKKDQENPLHSIQFWDIYEDDGFIGAITGSFNGRVEVHQLGDDTERKNLDVALQQVPRIWPLPGKPVIEDDPDLDQDLQSFILRNVEFINDDYGSLISHWVISSYISDFLTHYPRLVFYGPTHSGKSRALKIIKLLAYRSCSLTDATGPSVFRTIDKFRTTTIQDEYQQMKDENRTTYDSIFKAGFDKEAAICRCGEDNEPCYYFPWGPMAIGYKDGQLQEDMENRSILIPMSQKTRDDIPRRVDYNEAKELRTRLYALRYKVINEYDEYQPIFDEAWRIAEQPILTDVGEVFLNDRSIDMAANLIIGDLVTGQLHHSYGEDLELLAMSEAKAKETLRETYEAKIFCALQTILEVEKKSKPLDFDASVISTTDVAEQYNKDLSDQGNDHRDKVKTAKVGRALRELGFDFKPGHSGRSFFVQETFWPTYNRNLAKYGQRSMGV